MLMIQKKLNFYMIFSLFIISLNAAKVKSKPKPNGEVNVNSPLFKNNKINNVFSSIKYKGEVYFLNNSNKYFYENLEKTYFEINFKDNAKYLEIIFLIFKNNFYHNDYYRLYITTSKNIPIKYSFLKNLLITTKNYNNSKIGQVKKTHNNQLFWKKFPITIGLYEFYLSQTSNDTINGTIIMDNITLFFKGKKTKYSQNLLFCFYSNLYLGILFLTCLMQIGYLKIIHNFDSENQIYENISMIFVLNNILLTYHIGIFIFYIFIVTQKNTEYATLILILIILEFIASIVGQTYYRGELLGFFSPLFVFGIISMINCIFYWFYIYDSYKMIYEMITHSLGYRKLEVLLMRNRVSNEDQRIQLFSYLKKKKREISTIFIPIMFLSSFTIILMIIYPILMCVIYSLFFIPQIVHRLKVNKLIKKKDFLLVFGFYLVIFSDKIVTITFFLIGKFPLSSKPEIKLLKIFYILFFTQLIFLLIIDLFNIGFDNEFLKQPEYKFFETFNETLKHLPRNRRESVSKEECCICLDNLNKEQEEINYNLKEEEIFEIDSNNVNKKSDEKKVVTELNINDFQFNQNNLSFKSKLYNLLRKIKFSIKKIFVIKKSIEEKTKNKKFVITPCNHVFHSECLKNWIEAKSVCPLCNAQLPEI